MNLKTAVGSNRERRKTSAGAAFQRIDRAAEQFQMGAAIAYENANRNKTLADF
jgi:hypothetical protein